MSSPRPSSGGFLNATNTGAKAVSLSAFVKDDAPSLQKMAADVGQFLFGAAIAVTAYLVGPKLQLSGLVTGGGIAFGLIVAAPQCIRSAVSVLGSVVDLIAKARGTNAG